MSIGDIGEYESEVLRLLGTIVVELSNIRKIQERLAVPVASEMGRQAAALLTNKEARDAHNRAVLGRTKRK
jgi:hypothetical protein